MDNLDYYSSNDKSVPSEEEDFYDNHYYDYPTSYSSNELEYSYREDSHKITRNDYESNDRLYISSKHKYSYPKPNRKAHFADHFGTKSSSISGRPRRQHQDKLRTGSPEDSQKCTKIR